MWRSARKGEVRVRWRGLLVVCLLGAVLALQYTLWFGKNGITEWRALRGEIITRQQEIRTLQRRNHALKVEILDLQSGLEVVEERARNDLGLIAPGETFYQIVKPPSPP